MVYPTDEETFNERVSAEFVRDDHLNLVQAFLKRLQDFLGYGGRISDKFGIIVPPGVMFEWPDVNAPTGFLLCDAKQYNGALSDYADLYATIGKKYGGGADSLFHVPDRRGYFTRGYSKIPTAIFDPDDVNIDTDIIQMLGAQWYRSGFPVRFTTDDTLPAPLVINTTYFIVYISHHFSAVATTRANAMANIKINLTSIGVGNSYCHPYVEEDKDSRLALAEGGNDGEDLGSYQEDEITAHRHKIFVKLLGTAGANAWLPEQEVLSTSHFTTAIESVGGSETRPRNVNVNYIIKR